MKLPDWLKINGSWRTTLFGSSGLIWLIWNIAEMLTDGDPNTNPDWSFAIPAILYGIANVLSKDAVVTNASHPVKEGRTIKK